MGWGSRRGTARHSMQGKATQGVVSCSPALHGGHSLECIALSVCPSVRLSICLSVSVRRSVSTGPCWVKCREQTSFPLKGSNPKPCLALPSTSHFTPTAPNLTLCQEQTPPRPRLHRHEISPFTTGRTITLMAFSVVNLREGAECAELLLYVFGIR